MAGYGKAKHAPAASEFSGIGPFFFWRHRLGIVPMLDDFAVFVGIEEIRGQPFGLTVVDVLISLQKHMFAVLQRSSNLYIANWIALQKGFKESDEPFLTICDTGRMLRVTLPGIGCDGFPGISGLDSFYIKVDRVLFCSGHETPSLQTMGFRWQSDRLLFSFGSSKLTGMTQRQRAAVSF